MTEEILRDPVPEPMNADRRISAGGVEEEAKRVMRVILGTVPMPVEKPRERTGPERPDWDALPDLLRDAGIDFAPNGTKPDSMIVDGGIYLERKNFRGSRVQIAVRTNAEIGDEPFPEATIREPYLFSQTHLRPLLAEGKVPKPRTLMMDDPSIREDFLLETAEHVAAFLTAYVRARTAYRASFSRFPRNKL